MSTPEEEKILLEGLAREDKDSIERIYKDHFSMVKSLVMSNSGTPDDAADLFQDSMIVLFEKCKMPGFELNCLLRTFIYSVSKRLWLKKLEQSNRLIIQADDPDEETIAVEEEVVNHVKKQNEYSMMEDAMNKIGEPCKSLLDAYYVQKKQMQTIAADFGYTNADNAKTQKYKCLGRLKKLFFAQYKNLE